MMRRNKYLLEFTRKQLLQKTRRDGMVRYNRSKNYSITDYVVDIDELLGKGMLVIYAETNNDNIITVAMDGFFDELRKVVSSQNTSRVNLQTIVNALSRTVDSCDDVRVDCTCPDFQYRFAYVATADGYKYGRHETRPAKIRNPYDNLGFGCKHIISVLRSKSKWVVKCSQDINKAMKQYPNEFRSAMGVTRGELTIGRHGRPRNSEYRNTSTVIDDSENSNNNDEVS